jgi:hypothetical protein
MGNAVAGRLPVVTWATPDNRPSILSALSLKQVTVVGSKLSAMMLSLELLLKPLT